jgi:hypothetical protein
LSFHVDDHPRRVESRDETPHLGPVGIFFIGTFRSFHRDSGNRSVGSIGACGRHRVGTPRWKTRAAVVTT